MLTGKRFIWSRIFTPLAEARNFLLESMSAGGTGLQHQRPLQWIETAVAQIYKGLDDGERGIVSDVLRLHLNKKRSGNLVSHRSMFYAVDSNAERIGDIVRVSGMNDDGQLLRARFFGHGPQDRNVQPVKEHSSRARLREWP